jgi:O-acetyl-ADP-ribose deacetylase (regulator of RNase III)
MDIEIVVADATAVQGAEALVVPANRQLTLGWGTHVAEKVKALAGPDPEREALERHPRGIAMGEAVITGAGRLSTFRRLIHAAVLDKYDFNPLFLLRLRCRTSPATLRSATRSALAAAVAEGVRSLVFTPMGAGVGGMSDAACAGVMLPELRAHPEGTSVRRIVVACLKEKTARVFSS